jgi:ATP-dependent DNA ligase
VTRVARKSNRPKPSTSDLDLVEVPRAAIPRNIVPMLAGRAEKAFDGPDWIFEIKWDGYRAIAEGTRGQDLTGRRSPTCVIDGSR